MSDLQAIAASYERIDSLPGDMHDGCDAAGDVDERDRVACEQELDDQAYFVLFRPLVTNLSHPAAALAVDARWLNYR